MTDHPGVGTIFLALSIEGSTIDRMSVTDMNMDEKRILAEAAVDLLNELLQCDQGAVEALVEHRVPCNKKLLNHPTVQCNNTVGMLGIINALFGTIDEGPRKGWGLITAVFDDEDLLTGFKLTDEDGNEHHLECALKRELKLED